MATRPFLPPSWPLATVAYAGGFAGVALQRWLLVALADTALALCARAARSAASAALVAAFAALACAAAAVPATPPAYAFAHAAATTLAAASAAIAVARSRGRPALAPWTPGLLVLVPALLLLHSAALRLRALCTAGGGAPLALAWLDVAASLALLLLGLTQSRAAWVWQHCGLGERGKLATANDDVEAEGASAPLLHASAGDDRETLQPPPPSSRHDKASCLSVTLFSWLDPLFVTGQQRQLNLDDLEALPAGDATVTSAKSLEAAIEAAGHAPHLLPALLRVFGRDWAVVGLLQSGCVAMALISPLVLQQLLNYLQTDDSGGGGPGSPWTGLGWALAMVATQAGAALVTAQFSYRVARLQLRVRGALVPAIARRLLAAPLGARRAASAGALTNFVSVDVDRLLNAVPSWHQFWSLPLQVLIVIVELHSAVSLAAGAGLAVLAVLVPLNVWIAKRIGALTTVMMAARDERLRTTAELLRGMRAVKMGAFELPLLRRVAAARGTEFAALTQRKLLDAVCVWCWASTPLLMALATFTAVAALPDSAAALSPARVWSALAMLSLLIYPLNAFPWVLSGLLETRVSLRRLDEFLLGAAAPDGAPWAVGVREVSNGSGPLLEGGALLKLSGAFVFAAGETERATCAPAAIAAAPFILDLDSDGVLFGDGLSVLPGELLVICGRVGAGKSALVAALLGEMTPAADGSRLQARGRVLYASSCTFSLAPQTAWVRCATLRENVLLGENEDETRLASALVAAGLAEEAAMRGLDAVVSDTTLSGGQRQRLGLARALYSRSAVVVLDDPTAALDATVSAAVWAGAIGRGTSLLASEGRARVVITHDPRFVRDADRVLVLDGGRVLFCGPPSAMSRSIEASAGLRDEGEVETALAARARDAVTIGAVAAGLTVTFPAAGEDAGVEVAEAQAPPGPGGEEGRHVGLIRSSVVYTYAAAVGWPLTCITLAALLAMQVTRNGSDLLLSLWSSTVTDAAQASGPTAPLVRLLSNLNWTSRDFLQCFGVISALNFFFTAVRAWGFAAGGLRAAHSVHTRIVAAVVAAPQSFHDSTPAGRLHNRLSGDCFSIDDSLPFSLNILLAQVAGIAGTFAVLLFSTSGVFALLLPPLLIAFWRLQLLYRATSRELKRLDSTTRSPLLSQLAECRAGESVLISLSLQRPSGLSRTWGWGAGAAAGTGASAPAPEAVSLCAEDREAAALLRLLDASQRTLFASNMASQWLALRLQALGVATLAALVLACVLVRLYTHADVAAREDDACSAGANAGAGTNQAGGGGDAAAAGVAGLALSYALPVVFALQGLIGAFTDVEREMIAVERAKEYIDVEAEEVEGRHRMEAVLDASAAEAEKSSAGLPPSVWPTHGAIAFRGVVARYRPELEPALRGVSFTADGGQRIGVCGRTGSGKSSLVLSLFRILECEAGVIEIDGVNIASIGLENLRSRLAVVPQEPTLFSGTLRFNLDLFGHHSDAELEAAVARVELTAACTFLGGLDGAISEGGANLSAGQRQLVCLARALLQHARVLVLDEATASVDASTDRITQRMLRTAFVGATVLVIAHRMDAILDCDRVLVMDAGKIGEFGPPQELLARGGLFARLVQGDR